MGNHVKFNWKKIVIWGIFALFIGYTVYFFDTLLLQKNAIIFLSNYSNIVLTIWQVQATVSTLSIAVNAFIISKIDNAYYGISIKELLYLPRKSPKIWLSFWEMIISSIVIIALSWFFVVLDNIAATTWMLVISIFLTEHIISECVSVITKSEIYAQFANEIVEQIINVILESPYKYDIWLHNSNSSQTKWEATKSQREKRAQFRSIITNIDSEISNKLKSSVSLIDDSTFIFYLTTMGKFEEVDEAQLSNEMYNNLCDWIRQAVFDKDVRNIYHLLTASFSANKHRITDGLNIFLSAFYNGDISISIFNRVLDDICTMLQQAFFDNYTEIAISVLKFSIFNADADTFVKIIKSAYLIDTSYQRKPIKGNVLLVAFSYLYYIAYQEPYFQREKGLQHLTKIRDFTKFAVLEVDGKTMLVSDIISNYTSILFSVSYLFDFFETAYNNWEYMPIGTVKRMHLVDDIKEFLAYYCLLFYNRDCDKALYAFSLDVLLSIRHYIREDGSVETDYAEDYKEFCNWLSRPTQDSKPNDKFSTVLSAIIKKKLLAEANSIRKDIPSREEKLLELKHQITDKLKESSLFGVTSAQSSEDDYIRFESRYFMKSFSQHVFLYGVDAVILASLERSLFLRVKEYLDKYCIEFIDSDNIISEYTRFQEILSEQERKGLHIDRSYNFDFAESTKYMQFSSELLRKITDINNKITNAGRWECGGYCAIYVDSSKMNTCFSISNGNFLSVVDELSDEEITEEMKKYQSGTKYVFHESSNTVGISYTEEELRNFLKIAMFKIEYAFPISIPREKIGFYTFENQQVT